MIQEGWNHKKMPRETGFWVSAGRESLWTTGEKVRFSKDHCEVQKQPNLIFSFWGLYPLLKLKPHLKSFRLDSWPPGSSKSPIFPNFEVDLKKYIWKLKSADHGKTLFGPSTSLRHKNCRGVWHLDRLAAIWNLAFHHMECPTLITLISVSPTWNRLVLSEKQKNHAVLSYFR
jgi:hypothetical protein